MWGVEVVTLVEGDIGQLMLRIRGIPVEDSSPIVSRGSG